MMGGMTKLKKRSWGSGNLHPRLQAFTRIRGLKTMSALRFVVKSQIEIQIYCASPSDQL